MRTRWLVTSFLASWALVASACSSGGGGGGDPSSTESTSAPLDQTSGAHKGAIVPRLTPSATFSLSTVPANGDVNPYGVAFVPRGFPDDGLLHAGDVIVANFNNSQNLQGTGTTIVRANPGEKPTVFFHDARYPGLSTALVVLERGLVIVGNVPSTDASGMCTGNFDNVGPGALLVIDRFGRLVTTLTSASLLDGPWDMTARDLGDKVQLFVSDVITGTVTRFDVRLDAKDCDGGVAIENETQVASGYMHRCDPNAFVIGPTGLALDRDRDVLYVSSTGDNAIYAVAGASRVTKDEGVGKAVVTDTTHLHGPLGLVRAKNGNLISAQGDAVNADPNQPSEIVEFSPDGKFVDQISIDSGAGSAFGVALVQHEDAFRFAAVDDGTGVNVVHIWDVK